MNYYEVHIKQTCKPVFSQDGYYVWNDERKQFATMQEVKSFLKEQYGNSKREKMYVDDKDGNAKHIGFIYSYNSPKVSYDDTPKNNKDWIEVKEIKATSILPN